MCNAACFAKEKKWHKYFFIFALLASVLLPIYQYCKNRYLSTFYKALWIRSNRPKKVSTCIFMELNMRRSPSNLHCPHYAATIHFDV